MFPKNKSYKSLIKYIIPLVISVGLCIVLYSGVDFAVITDALHRCDFALIVSALLCNVLAQVFRAARWRMQLRAIGVNPPMRAMLCAIFGTYAVNIVFPRLGEVWRCAYVAKRQDAQFSAVFGSMVADRLADTLSVLLLTLLTLCLAAGAMQHFMSQASLPINLGWVVAGGVIIVVLFALLLIYGKNNKFIARVREAVMGAMRGFASTFKMKRPQVWLLLTAAIWLSYFSSMWLFMQAFPPTSAVGAVAVLVTFVFGSLAMAIPSNGGIGPWQWAIIISLTGVYGIAQEQSLAFATINLGFTTLLSIVLGLATFAAIAIEKK
jgi:uncharacterized protein (TIRG00374 family)